MIQIGDRIGDRYVVESLLAKGGMGNIYLVRDEKLDHKLWVAKEITQVSGQEKFLEEARVLIKLTHPYISRIIDYFEPNHEGKCYLIIEYIEGRTLQELFEQSSRKLPLPAILKYLLQLCDILTYLHGLPEPIIFRDLKPENIMVDEMDNIRLIDFGIARNYVHSKLTDTVQMGTVAFAAPEQFENRQTDPRTDIYSLGSTLYYLLSEGRYFIHSQSSDDWLADVPIEWVNLIRKLLATKPDERYQDIREVTEELTRIQLNATITKTVRLSSDNYPLVIANNRANNPHQANAYTTQATQGYPALIIYLIDVSGSMNFMNGEKRRLDVVTDSLFAALKQMVFRSTKGSRISSRYRISILAYSDEVHDLLGGIKNIDELMNTGQLPTFTTQRFTDTAKAFIQAERILQRELPHMQNCPAPLICHMTDGVYTGEDPEPIARRIMNMSVKDGHVLIENIFISDEVLEKEITHPKRWSGIHADTMFRDDYGYKLRTMSSIIPESYRQLMRDSNYNLAEGAYLMFPGLNPELVSLGFQMSAATPIHEL